MLSLLLVLSLSSSSSSLDKITIKKMLNTSGISFLSVKYVNIYTKAGKIPNLLWISSRSFPELRLIKTNEDTIHSI